MATYTKVVIPPSGATFTDLVSGGLNGQLEALITRSRTAPTATPTGADDGSGSTGVAPTGTYKFQYTYVDGFGNETLPSPESAGVEITSPHTATITFNDTLPTGYKRNLYMTSVGGSLGSERLLSGTAQGITDGTYVLSTATYERVASSSGTAAPTAAPTGADDGEGSTGVAPTGTYKFQYTYVDDYNIETLPSPESDGVEITNPHTATITFNDTLPAGCKRNLYMTSTGGSLGSERLLSGTAQGITDDTYVLSTAKCVQTASDAGTPAPTVAPTGADDGSGTTGVAVDGTYLFQYTYVDAYGVETLPSPASVGVAITNPHTATITFGDTLPAGCRRNVYMTSAGGAIGTARLLSGGSVTSDTYSLAGQTRGTQAVPTTAKACITAVPTIAYAAVQKVPASNAAGILGTLLGRCRAGESGNLEFEYEAASRLVSNYVEGLPLDQDDTLSRLARFSAVFTLITTAIDEAAALIRDQAFTLVPKTGGLGGVSMMKEWS